MRKLRNIVVDESTCPSCNSPDIRKLVLSDTIDFRGLELDVEDMEVSVCNNCKNRFENTHQKAINLQKIKTSYSLERDRLRKRDGLLSGAEIAEIRNHFELNQREAAIIFGGGSNAFNKYESGEVLQSIAMDRLLRLSRQIGDFAIDTLLVINQKCRPGFDVAKNRALTNNSSISIKVTMSDNLSEQNLYISNEKTKSQIIATLIATTFTPLTTPRNIDSMIKSDSRSFLGTKINSSYHFNEVQNAE